MNIIKLRNIIRPLPTINDITYGNEFNFTQKIKYILPTTNFELLGEQLVIGKDNIVGKCDLWLANVPNNFLMSLELKVGKPCDSQKKKHLNTQVYRYTDFMRYYFPEDVVYGMGAYKCITCTKKEEIKGTEIIFIDYITPTVNKHSEEIKDLKHKMITNCLN